jgi:hypothetical protein
MEIKNSNIENSRATQLNNLKTHEIPTNFQSAVDQIKTGIIEKDYKLGSGNQDLESSLQGALNHLGYNDQSFESAVLTFKKDNYLDNGAEIGPSTLKALAAQLGKNTQEKTEPSLNSSSGNQRENFLESLNKTSEEKNIIPRSEVLVNSREVVSLLPSRLQDHGNTLLAQLEKGDFGIKEGQASSAIESLKHILSEGGYYEKSHGFSKEANDAVRAAWNAYKDVNNLAAGTAVGVHSVAGLLDEVQAGKVVGATTDLSTTKLDLSKFPLLGDIVKLDKSDVPGVIGNMLGKGAVAGVKLERGHDVLRDLIDKGYLQIVNDKGEDRVLPGGNTEKITMSSISHDKGFWKKRAGD